MTGSVTRFVRAAGWLIRLNENLNPLLRLYLYLGVIDKPWMELYGVVSMNERDMIVNSVC